MQHTGASCNTADRSSTRLISHSSLSQCWRLSTCHLLLHVGVHQEQVPGAIPGRPVHLLDGGHSPLWSLCVAHHPTERIPRDYNTQLESFYCHISLALSAWSTALLTAAREPQVSAGGESHSLFPLPYPHSIFSSPYFHVPPPPSGILISVF